MGIACKDTARVDADTQLLLFNLQRLGFGQPVIVQSNIREPGFSKAHKESRGTPWFGTHVQMHDVDLIHQLKFAAAGPNHGVRNDWFIFANDEPIQ